MRMSKFEKFRIGLLGLFTLLLILALPILVIAAAWYLAAAHLP